MQIVIDIPEDTYEECQGHKYYIDTGEELFDAVKNGVILPKGHGRLIDANSLLNYGSCPNSCSGTVTCAEDYEHLHCPIRVFDIESINDTPTIIKADKAESENKE